MKRFCVWLIRLYQKYLSPRKRRPSCRFYPSCSAFAVEAYEKRGFFAGTLLTFFRILRCNPFCPGGYDPVPERGITVRSYWATHRREPLQEDEDAKENETCSPELQDADDNDSEGATGDQSPAPQTNAPAAGGNPSDRRETAAVSDAGPKKIGAKYFSKDKTLR